MSNYTWPNASGAAPGNRLGASLTRSAAETPRTRQLAGEVMREDARCIGCTECQGICMALADVMTLPEIIVKDRTA